MVWPMSFGVASGLLAFPGSYGTDRISLSRLW